MTPRELAVLRDQVSRARIGKDSPRRGDGGGELAIVEPAPGSNGSQADSPRIFREPRYPVMGRTSILECPVHQLIVALNEEGRVCSGCPGCRSEAATALGMVA